MPFRHAKLTDLMLNDLVSKETFAKSEQVNSASPRSTAGTSSSSHPGIHWPPTSLVNEPMENDNDEMEYHAEYVLTRLNVPVATPTESRKRELGTTRWLSQENRPTVSRESTNPASVLRFS